MIQLDTYSFLNNIILHICAIYFFFWKKTFKKATTYLHLHPFFYSYINHLNFFFFVKAIQHQPKEFTSANIFFCVGIQRPQTYDHLSASHPLLYTYTYMTMFWSCVWVYFVTKNFGVRLKHNREYDILCRHTYYLIRKVLTIVLPT